MKSLKNKNHLDDPTGEWHGCHSKKGEIESDIKSRGTNPFQLNANISIGIGINCQTGKSDFIRGFQKASNFISNRIFKIGGNLNLL